MLDGGIEQCHPIHSISLSCENGVQLACVMSGEISSTDPTESQNPPGSDSDKSHYRADRTREGRSRNCPSRLFAAIWIRSPLCPSSPALLSPLPFRWRRKWGLSRRLRRRRRRLCVRELFSFGVPLPYLSVPSPQPLDASFSQTIPFRRGEICSVSCARLTSKNPWHEKKTLCTDMDGSIGLDTITCTRTHHSLDFNQ